VQGAGCREKLVHTFSEDDFRLDGVAVHPDGVPPHPVAVIIIHGLYAAFYDTPYVALARGLARAGYTTLSGNTRGHDFGAVLRTPDWRIVAAGGGWERLEECPRDVGAWIAFAQSLGFERVVLFGLCLGARKVVYHQGTRQDPAVVAMVLGSPRAINAPDDAAITDLAHRMVEGGLGRDLLPWPEFGCSMSATTFLDHEDPAALFRHLMASDHGPTLLGQITCPILAFYGEDEVGDGRDPAGELEVVRRNATSAAAVETTIVPEADHLYTDHEADVAGLVAAWLDALP